MPPDLSSEEFGWQEARSERRHSARSGDNTTRLLLRRYRAVFRSAYPLAPARTPTRLAISVTSISKSA